MKTKRSTRCLLIALSSLMVLIALIACNPPSEVQQVSQVSIIPQPAEITYQPSSFTLSPKTTIYYPSGDSSLQKSASLLQDYLHQALGVTLPIAVGNENSKGIVLSTGLSGNEEAYELSISHDRIRIQGASDRGTFWGIQTLRQVIPAHVTQPFVSLPGLTIKDRPRFPYRGMHLDVCRHFFPVSDVEKYIDLLALHKINYFHWHLTDDQGWRIEIKKYPKLTQIGAYRDSTLQADGTYEVKKYGGFYTQEQAREVVKYAADRFITVIPEFDLPGHTVGALASYPELGCTGGPYSVRAKWGVSQDVLCAGNEKSFEFIDNVMDELMSIFPGPYIHLGGDECPKTRWKQCPKCQARLKSEHLKNEEELQSYVINRTAKYLQSKGRKVIGWDEILEGGLASNTTIMSWRGTAGGIQAAQQGHDVIMSPVGYCYFSRSQKLPAINGYLPLSKVYQFNPIPQELSPEEAKHIIGAEACMWTEHQQDLKNNIEPMLLPRLAALSEVLWSAPEQRNWIDFKQRLFHLVAYYDAIGAHYDQAVYEAAIELHPNFNTKIMEVHLSTFSQYPIHYTLDGSTPDTTSPLYTQALHFDSSFTLKATVDLPHRSPQVSTQSVVWNRAALSKASTTSAIEKRFEKALPNLFTDLIRGSGDLGDGKWVGLAQGNIAVTLDLGTSNKAYSAVSVGCLVNPGAGVVGPVGIEVYTSKDNKTFHLASKTILSPTSPQTRIGTHDFQTHFPPTTDRYVRVVTQRQSKLPRWQDPTGRSDAYLFIDEISVQ